MDHVTCIVVGAGVVGLAIARELAQSGREVVIVEVNHRIGEETSSRSNEVIHAGFLYPPGSLKERMCLRGRDLLYAYCRAHDVGHRMVGKLVPALDEAELATLERVYARALELGVPGVEMLDGDQARALEPNLQCRGAIHSPISGIVDSHGLMISLLADAEAHGAMLALGTRVDAVHIEDSGRFRIEFEADGVPGVMTSDILVNASGLGAQRLASRIDGYPAGLVPQVYFAKGSFFSYQGKSPFSRLIMPVGDTLWRGGAYTLDLAGQGRFGPDLEWAETRDYSLRPESVANFVANISRYWPGVTADRLQASYAGIRPRLTGPGEPVGDWGLQGPREHGIANLVNLFAVETPGLTSCLATAEHVVRECELLP